MAKIDQINLSKKSEKFLVELKEKVNRELKKKNVSSIVPVKEINQLSKLRNKAWQFSQVSIKINTDINLDVYVDARGFSGADVGGAELPERKLIAIAKTQDKVIKEIEKYKAFSSEYNAKLKETAKKYKVSKKALEDLL